jgi:uroporphyrin-III C-methyltransferase
MKAGNGVSGLTGKVYLIGAGPGDPGLLTLKGKLCIESADVILYDRLVSPDVLDFARPDAERVYVGKAANDHAYRQQEINQLLVQHALAGHTVVRLKGGDPFVFGRGAEEAEALVEHGVPFEIVPGVTSAVAAPAYAGIPLTYRGVASGFHVVTGHEALTSAGVAWDLLAASEQTLVILMGLHHLGDIAERLMRHGRPAETPVAMIQWGTTSQQTVVTGSLATIATEVERAGIGAPAVIVVGEVVRVAERLQWFPADSAGDDTARPQRQLSRGAVEAHM